MTTYLIALNAGRKKENKTSEYSVSPGGDMESNRRGLGNTDEGGTMSGT